MDSVTQMLNSNDPKKGSGGNHKLSHLLYYIIYDLESLLTSMQTVLELKRAILSSLIKQKCAIPSTINANSAKLVALGILCTSLGY